jgi:diphosphomevalonate decarboxylase
MWEASAPSNIALIKYMGKSAEGKNVGVNPSLSLTLPHLRSQVLIQEHAQSDDTWEALDGKMTLSETGKEKFLKHFSFLKEKFGLTNKKFIIRSKNDFPSDCGIASSASSFAALTTCAAQAFGDITGQKISLEEQALLSRYGSGSSCRSFSEGFVEWDGNNSITPLPSTHADLFHQVYIVSSSVKTVSSSQAHQRVATSSLMPGRTERVQLRMNAVKNILKAQKLDWENLYSLVWAEFWDMHALFETSQPPFGYFLPNSLKLIQQARDLWETDGDGPIVTMDAGPNVHFLWRKDQLVSANFFANRNSDIRCFSNMEMP